MTKIDYEHHILIKILIYCYQFYTSNNVLHQLLRKQKKNWMSNEYYNLI